MAMPPGRRETRGMRGGTSLGHPTTTPGTLRAVLLIHNSGPSPWACSYGCSMPPSRRSQAHPPGPRSRMWKRNKWTRRRVHAGGAALSSHDTRGGCHVTPRLYRLTPTASFNSLSNVLVLKGVVTSRSWLTSDTLRWSWDPTSSVSSGAGTFGRETEV